MLKNSSFQWWYLLFFFTFLQGFHQLCVLCLSPFHHDFHLPNACNLTSFLCPLNSSLFALVQPFNLKHSCLGDLLSDSHVGDPEQTWDYLISVWSFSTSPVFLYPLFSIIGYSGMFVLEKKIGISFTVYMKHSAENFSEQFYFFSFNFLPRSLQTKNECHIIHT